MKDKKKKRKGNSCRVQIVGLTLVFHVTLSMEEPFASICISLEPQNLKKPKTLAPQFYIIKCFTMIEVASYQKLMIK